MFIVFVIAVIEDISTVEKGGFLQSPVSQNIAVDTVAVFRCHHPTATLIAWKINGTLIDQTMRSDFPEGVTINRNISVATLTFVALLEYNQTRIQCVAFFTDFPSEETNPAILLIQGTSIN